MAVGWWYGEGEEEVVEEGGGVRTLAAAAAAALEKYEAVGGFPAGVRGDWPATAVRERGEWRANWVGEVRLMGEKLESDDPPGVGGDRRAVYG